jgi:threonine/homoserine/homoserine lactone efflux protein
MIDALIKGLTTGFILSWTFGTVFFALIQTSLEHGWKKGMQIAAGVALSDILFITIAVAGTALIPGITNYREEIGIGGGILLIALGLSMFFKKNKALSLPKAKWASFMYFFTQGFLLNILNPLNFFSWLAISTIISAYGFTLTETSIYYIAVIVMIFICETLIAYTAHILKRFFTDRILKLVDIVSGIVFMGIGVYLILDNTIGLHYF